MAKKKNRNTADTEFSSDFAGHARGYQTKTAGGNKTLGWIALIFAIASLFYWPAVLGPAAAIIGVIAYIRGNRALGVWSVAIGLIALLAFLFLIPYYS